MSRFLRPWFLAPTITQWIIRLVTLGWWKVFSRLEVHGLENLRTLTGPVLFVSNHTSEWDGPLIRSVMPMWSQFTPMFYVSLPKKYYQTADRDFIRRALWGGTTFKLVGAWPVYKGTGDLNKALVHHLDILRKGGSITIFPEGGVSKNGTIAPFKVGAPFLVSQTGVTVVPVAITGLSFPLIPEGARRRRVTVEFGAPVRYPADVSPSPESLEATALDMHTRVVSLARRFYPGA